MHTKKQAMERIDINHLIKNMWKHEQGLLEKNTQQKQSLTWKNHAMSLQIITEKGIHYNNKQWHEIDNSQSQALTWKVIYCNYMKLNDYV